MADFKLSAVLAGHDKDVRQVKFPSSDAALTTSRDNTVRIWRRTAASPPTFEPSITTHGHEPINSLAFLPPSPDYPDGLVISGGRDALIDIRKPNSDPTHDAERLLIGHADNVCALDVSPRGTYIVSGGWDGQARVWSVAKWETDMLLEGHGTGSNEYKGVWGVLAYDEFTVITGCADHMIRGYDLRHAKGGVAQPSITVATPEVVRALCRVPKNHPSGAEIASAGNDGVIRLWKLAGQQVAELHGHESYIYALSSLPSGELVSSGEDRTVRIWRGSECVQTITHPALSVWSVAVCQESGDIVSGASDNLARIFTRSPDRLADAEAARQFEESVKASAIPQQQMGNVNKEKLPGPDFLTAKSGTKDGQTILIKQNDGSVSAHKWSMSSQQWEMIGTVVDAAGSSGRKVEYQGQSYDYVFDVDIEDGKPPLKLPYNLSENPYDRATKFLGDNNLPVSYLESVANFIVQNTQGATLGQGTSQPGADPYGTEQRYRPGQQSQSSPASSAPATSALANKEYVTLVQAKFAPIEKKISSVNSDLIKSGQKEFALNPEDMSTMRELFEILTAATEKMPASIPATSSQAPTNVLPLADLAFTLVMKVACNWPYNSRLPAFDLLRCMCPSEAAAKYEDGQGRDIVDAVLFSVLTAGSADTKIVENSIMMVLRAVVNLFVTEKGRSLAAAKAGTVVTVMECVLGMSDPPMGDVKGPIGANNRGVLVALTSAAINYAVLAYTEQKAGRPSSAGTEALTLLINVLGRVLVEQTDSEVVFRALVALGHILSTDGDGDYVATAKSLGAASWLTAAKTKASEDRVRHLATSVSRLLT